MDVHQTVVMFLSLGLLIGFARALGETARWFGQPALLGEILAGVLLGPTVLGHVAPGWQAFLFPGSGSAAVFLQGFMNVSIALFLVVAGMEVDLSTVWRQGRSTMIVGMAGLVCPFAIAFSAAWMLPLLRASRPASDPLIFSLFFATAISITSLPFIARTLMDLSLYRSDMGMIVIAAAIFNDLAGWIIFAVVLGMMRIEAVAGFSIGRTILLTLLFAVGVLTVGRWAVHKVLPWLQAHTTWPGAVLSFSLASALLGAAFTDWIGVHAIFGAFLVGVAIGDSTHLRESTRTIIGEFASFVFAPVFFAGIGLRVDFVSNFSLPLVLAVLAIACIGKLPGCYLGARAAGLGLRESWAIGFGMNARGAMQIILGLLALQYGLIGNRMFVALVIMAIATTMISGPAMKWVLRLRGRRHFSDYLSAKAFVMPLVVADVPQAIRRLAEGLAATTGVPAEEIVGRVLAREQLMPTGLGNGIAVPHARVPGLAQPAVAVGISRGGVDFNAPDGEAAHIIVMIMIPDPHDGTEVQILSDIARTFGTPRVRSAATNVTSYTEFLALVRNREMVPAVAGAQAESQMRSP